MLNHRKWTDDHHKVHFESGVRLGAGSFNLVSSQSNLFGSSFFISNFHFQMISLLPQRILKLLEFIGFSGSRVRNEVVTIYEFLR